MVRLLLNVKFSVCVFGVVSSMSNSKSSVKSSWLDSVHSKTKPIHATTRSFALFSRFRIETTLFECAICKRRKMTRSVKEMYTQNVLEQQMKEKTHSELHKQMANPYTTVNCIETKRHACSTFMEMYVYFGQIWAKIALIRQHHKSWTSSTSLFFLFFFLYVLCVFRSYFFSAFSSLSNDFQTHLKI